MTKKEIEDWIKAFNQSQIERMKEEGQEGNELEEYERFIGGGEWSVEIVAPQALLDLLPEWESKNWWEVDVLDEGGNEGVFELEHEALDEYGVKSIDEINAHFARRFYQLSLEEEEWWEALAKEIEGKTGLPFEDIRVTYC